MLSVEDEWWIVARDRAPSRDGGSMWFLLAIGFVALYESGRDNYGKMEITGRED
jgi:hypothetical protein